MNEEDLKKPFQNYTARQVNFNISDSFLKKISLIPHLKLKIDIDLEKLRDDFKVLDNDFAPYELSHPDEETKVYWPRWSGRYIVNWVPYSKELVGTPYYHDTENIMTKYYSKYQNAKSKWEYVHYKTEIYNQMPYVKSILEDTIGTENHYRVAIMKIPKGEYIPWHTHNEFLFSKDEEFQHKTSVIHFPIYTNTNCIMLTKTPDQKIHAQHYGAGEAWLLQEYFDHGVDNINGNDRYHLIIHVKLTGNVRKIIEDSL
jgi:hypothetical protein